MLGDVLNKYPANNVYTLDVRELLQGGLNIDNAAIVTDPPYNLGYHYDEYDGNMPEAEYFGMLSAIIGDKPAAVLHYPEALHRLSMTMGRVPDRVVSWVYNSNTARQHRDIAFYGIKPDFSKTPQPYKNLADRRILERIAAGKTCKGYDWFEVNQVKNVGKLKDGIDHPCVIPLEVMDKVVRLIPEGLAVVDPFAGSGTTLVAAARNGRGFLGFERSAAYCEIARRRIGEVMANPGFF